MATTMLEHLNTPPAQTWNRLSINDTTFGTPSPSQAPQATPVALPLEVRDIAGGAGTSADTWLSAAATLRRTITVPASSRPDEPLVIDIDGDGSTIAETNVVVGEGAAASVVVIARGTSDSETASGNLLRVTLAKDATARIYEIVALPASQRFLDSVGISCAEGSSVDVRQYLLGAGSSVAGLACDLIGDHASIALATRYLGRGSAAIDINHVVHQRGRLTRATLDESGVLSDASEKTLRATIDLVRGCKGSRGREQETVLVSGDDVVNKTLPVILCDEDDVAGDHGATIGSVSPEQLGYLAGRGLTEAEAEELFVRAAFADAAIQAPTTGARAATLSLAARVLGDDATHDLEEGLPTADETESEPRA